MTTAAYDLIKNDYLKFDNVETVTFTAVTTGTAVATAKAMFEPGSEAEAMQMAVSLGFSPDRNAAFIVLFDTTLSGQRAEAGGKIRFSATDIWSILKAAHKTFRTRWRCFCVKDRIED